MRDHACLGSLRMEGTRPTLLIFVCGSNGSFEYCRTILVIQVIEQLGNRENSPLNRGGKNSTFGVECDAHVRSSILPWAVRMPISDGTNPHDQSSPAPHQSAMAQIPQDQSSQKVGLQKYYDSLSIRTL
jgi:hypothetical protein